MSRNYQKYSMSVIAAIAIVGAVLWSRPNGEFLNRIASIGAVLSVIMALSLYFLK